ncbi:ABC transporter substrate-binding protein [Cryptosporangium sp. NPDC048952]|uniref:ABC transporter substrate-binding protein n=1 Tax=Cryptosporangium sp. NPDC048952 TaxID=3363961 RepID=UPI0037182DF0
MRVIPAAVALALVLATATACADKSRSSTSDNDLSTGSTSQAIADAPDGTFAGKKASGSPVKIGLINNENGASVSQPEGRVAATAVVEYANANLGGLGGHPIDLIICKQKEEPASAADCANQMVEKGVAAVVVSDTGFGSVMAPIIQKAKIPYVSYNAASGAELSAKDYGYAWTGGFPGDLNGMAQYAKQKNMKDVTMFAFDVPAVTTGAKAIGIPAFAKQGVKLTVVSVPPGTPDATPQVSAGLKTNPQAIAEIGDATFCTSILKAMTALGSKAEKWIIQSCYDPTVFKAVGPALDGAKMFSTGDGVTDDPEAKIYRAIMAKYAPGAQTTGAAVPGYQSMMGLIRGASAVTGDVTAASINQAIRAAKNVPVPAGHGGTMTCDGTALPSFPSVCSGSSVVSTIQGTKVVDSSLLR